MLQFAALAAGLLLLLLLFRRRGQTPTPVAAPTKPQLRSEPSGASSQWWFTPLASSVEEKLIAEALAIVHASDLAPLPPHVEIDILRQVRVLGSSTTPEKLADAYSKNLRWRREHVLRPLAACAADQRRLWYPARDHAHGEWARTRLQVGLCIGRATGGHPVKIELVGNGNMAAVCREPGGAQRMLDHYFCLLETMLLALNAESAASGRLLQMFEIFDLRGMSIFKTSVAALRAVTALVGIIVSVYGECTAKAVLVNMPPTVAAIVRAILALLPERVQCRVTVVGEGETYDFSGELDESALRMMHADADTLTAHVGAPLPGSALPVGPLPGRPWTASEACVAAPPTLRGGGEEPVEGHAEQAEDAWEIVSAETQTLARGGWQSVRSVM